MVKKWQRHNEGTFGIFIDGKEAGRMEIAFGDADRKASITINGLEYILQRTGLWRNTIDLSDGQGYQIGKIYWKKWYANEFVFELRGKDFRLLIRNNPLAEWVLAEGEQDILAYALHAAGGKVDYSIRSYAEDADPLFDCILWYLFAPIAIENMAADKL